MSEKFDFGAALKAIQSGQAITGKDGVLAPLVKQLTEAALEGELDSHLADDVAGNCRNGKSKKTVKSTSGKFELEILRLKGVRSKSETAASRMGGVLQLPSAAYRFE